MNKVIDKDHGYKHLKKMLNGATIDVGYWAGEFKNDGTDLAEIARANEYGVGSKGISLVKQSLGVGNRRYIPERSFMRSTYDQNIELLMEEYKKFLGQDLLYRTRRADIKLGGLLTGMIKKKIRSASSWATPNAPATIKAKGSSTPLNDTGMMRQKIDFRIKINAVS